MASVKKMLTGNPSQATWRRRRRNVHTHGVNPAGTPGQTLGMRPHATDTMNSVRPSAPPNAQAMPCCELAIRCAMRPPCSTRTNSLLRGEATQTAPSASRQMPSGAMFVEVSPQPTVASVPSLAMSNAVKRRPKVSARIMVRPSGVITAPLGNNTSSGSDGHLAVGRNHCQHGWSGLHWTHKDIEAEIADIGTTAGIHHHVVARKRGEAGQIRRHCQIRSRPAASACDPASTPPAGDHPAASPIRTAGWHPTTVWARPSLSMRITRRVKKSENQSSPPPAPSGQHASVVLRQRRAP